MSREVLTVEEMRQMAEQASFVLERLPPNRGVTDEEIAKKIGIKPDTREFWALLEVLGDLTATNDRPGGPPKLRGRFRRTTREDTQDGKIEVIYFDPQTAVAKKAKEVPRISYPREDFEIKRLQESKKRIPRETYPKREAVLEALVELLADEIVSFELDGVLKLSVQAKSAPIKEAVALHHQLYLNGKFARVVSTVGPVFRENTFAWCAQFLPWLPQELIFMRREEEQEIPGDFFKAQKIGELGITTHFDDNTAHAHLIVTRTSARVILLPIDSRPPRHERIIVPEKSQLWFDPEKIYQALKTG